MIGHSDVAVDEAGSRTISILTGPGKVALKLAVLVASLAWAVLALQGCATHERPLRREGASCL